MCSPQTKNQLTYKHTYDITIYIFSHIKRLWNCPKNYKPPKIKSTEIKSTDKKFNYEDMWGQFEPLD